MDDILEEAIEKALAAISIPKDELEHPNEAGLDANEKTPYMSDAFRFFRDLQAVMQFLKELEFTDTLKVLEGESGTKFMPDFHGKRTSVLSQGLDFMNESLGKVRENQKEKTSTSSILTELLSLSPSVSDDEPDIAPKRKDDDRDKFFKSEPALHASSNVLCVKLWPFSVSNAISIVTSAADGYLRLIKFEEKTFASRMDLGHFSSPVLSLDIGLRQNEWALIAFTCMDGSHGIIELVDINKPHSPESDNTLKWSPNFFNPKHSGFCHIGKLFQGRENTLQFVTLSKDKSMHVYDIGTGQLPTEARYPQACAPSNVQPTSDEFTLKYVKEFPSEPLSMCAYHGLVDELPSTDKGAMNLAIISLRSSTSIWYVSVQSGATVYKARITPPGDDVPPYDILGLSTQRKLLAFCTDSSRVILMPLFSNVQLCVFYGVTTDPYSTVSLMLSPDLKNIYCSSSAWIKDGERTRTGGRLVCWATPNQRLITNEKLPTTSKHFGTLRSVDCDQSMTFFVCGSFDKTISITYVNQ